MRRFSIVLMMVFMIALVIMPSMAVADSNAQTCGPSVTHVVAAGENLFRISLRYGTTMNAIASANGIFDINRIYYGQQLTIPCLGSQPQVYVPPVSGVNSIWSPPVVVFPPAVAQPLAQVYPFNGSPFVAPLTADCTRFRPTSPLDGLANGSNVFYWDGAPGATSYRVNIYNLSISGGPLMVSYETPGTLTHLQGDVGDGAVGSGSQFAWEIQALVGGQVACSSRVTLLRSVGATPVPTMIMVPTVAP